MSDDKPTESIAEPIYSEIVPSQAGTVSAIASASAPFIYTDWIGSHGIRSGVANITLEAIRHMLVNEKPVADRVVVAHLRMPYGSLQALKEAIAQIELLARAPATDTRQ